MTTASLRKTNVAIQDQLMVKSGKSTRMKVENTYTEEIVISICSPIGSLRTPVIEEFENQLKKTYKYNIKYIKLSEYVKKYASKKDKFEEGHTLTFTEPNNKILGGNELREKYENYSILAELAIADIYNERMAYFKKGDELPQ